MKSKTLVVVMGLMLMSSASFANAEGPCKKVAEACKAAGFTKGGHKKDGKGLFKDCMGKLVKGESVEGVTVAANDLAACKAKRAEKK